MRHPALLRHAAHLRRPALLRRTCFAPARVALASLALLACASCARHEKPPSPRGSGPLRAVCTTTMVADLVRTVAGSDLQIVTLMGPGVDPHQYRLTKAARRQLADSDIIFSVGLGLEARIADILEKVARDRPVIALADSLHPTLLVPDPEDPERFDPHIWFDPVLWLKASNVVRNALQRADPAHATGYGVRADAFVSSVGPLVQWAEATLDSVPVQRRILATAHGGFAYFARAFKWESISREGARTELAGRAKGDPLIELLVTRRVLALFVTSTESPEAAARIAAEAKKRGFELRIVEGFLGDALDAPGTPGGSWPGALRHDVETLLATLR